jgi:hypothetical protein
VKCPKEFPWQNAPEKIYIVEWKVCSHELGGIWFATKEEAEKHALYWAKSTVSGIREYSLCDLRTKKQPAPSGKGGK